MPPSEIRCRHLTNRRDLHIKSGFRANIERPRQKQIRLIRPATVPHNKDIDHLTWRDHKIKRIVGRQNVRRNTDDTLHRLIAKRNRIKINCCRTVGRQRCRNGFNGATLHFECHIEPVNRCITPICESGRHLNPLPTGKIFSFKQHTGHAHICRQLVPFANADRCYDRALRKTHTGGTLNTRPLKITNQYSLKSR